MAQQLPEHSEWQHRLFYIIVALMFYQMGTLGITSVGCAIRHVWQNQAILSSEVCKAAGEDTDRAVEKYLTLVLAILSKVPGSDPPVEPRTPRKRREPEVKPTPETEENDS
jgi:hypothetical protein